MLPDKFLADFRTLHGLAKRGSLDAAQRREYESACATLSSLMLAAQRMSNDKGTMRGALRMAQVRKLEIVRAGAAREVSSTIDLGEAGFATMLSSAIPIGEQVAFVLHLPAAPINGNGIVVSCKPMSRAFRVSCELRELAWPARDALRSVIIDTMLQRLGER